MKYENKKKLLSGVLAVMMVMGLLVGEIPTVNAAEKTEAITAAEDTIEFLDENGKVMAIFTPYSETNPAPASLDATANVNVSLAGNLSGYLSNQYTLSNGTNITLNISISPQVSSNVGLYDRNTKTYGWPAGGLSSSGWYGTLTVAYDGTFSLAFKNNSSTTANYTGTYSL